MLLNDRQIRSLCSSSGGMIEPFMEAVSGGGVISYGLTSAGYDLRLAEDVYLFDDSYPYPIDPKKFADADYRVGILRACRVHGDFGRGKFVVLPPNSYALGRSHEYLRIPRYLKARCVGKSTLARCGILVNTTPLEPEWEGHLTIEIGNVTPLPALLYVMEGIAQLEFETLTGEPEVSYKDKGGKYYKQTGVTPAIVDS